MLFVFHYLDFRLLSNVVVCEMQYYKVYLEIPKSIFNFTAMKKKTQQFSLHEYIASEYNTDGLAYCSATKRIRKNQDLPNVKTVTKFSRVYILQVYVVS